METARTQTCRFATFSHAHFQGHDLRSREYSLVFVSYLVFENIVTLEYYGICSAPFIKKINTVFRIVLICIIVVSFMYSTHQWDSLIINHMNVNVFSSFANFPANINIRHITDVYDVCTSY